MKEIRLLVYVLLCGSMLTNVTFAADKANKQQRAAACPTSPVYKKDQANVDHATSPIQKENSTQSTVDHRVTPIDATAMITIIVSGSTATKGKLGIFPSYPSLASCASLDRLDSTHKALSSTFSAEELASQLSEKKQFLGYLNPNTSGLFDHGTTPVSPKKK